MEEMPIDWPNKGTPKMRMPSPPLQIKCEQEYLTMTHTLMSKADATLSYHDT